MCLYIVSSHVSGIDDGVFAEVLSATYFPRRDLVVSLKHSLRPDSLTDVYEQCYDIDLCQIFEPLDDLSKHPGHIRPARMSHWYA